MTNNNIKNNKTTMIISAIVIGLGLLSPTSIMPNVNAVNELSMPKPIVNWLTTHPHFAGCLTGNLKDETIKEVSCIHPHMRPMSWGPTTIDCSSHCFAGGEFDYYSSYDEITGDTDIGSAPSSAQTNYALSYWDGLTNCSGSGSSGPSCPSSSLLVQGGWLYNATNTGSLNGPFMFTEIWGDFQYGSVYCDTTFCGNSLSETAGDSISTENYADVTDSEWVAYATDNNDFDYVTTVIPFSDTGLSDSLPYPVVSLEAYDAPTTSYFPSSSISFTSVTLYVPNTGMVDAYSSSMKDYNGPTSSTGISMSYSATGTTTASITNSWS
ncbi:MAG: hypothetical protein WAN47_08890 [Nitrosotalea sp.]